MAAHAQHAEHAGLVWCHLAMRLSCRGACPVRLEGKPNALPHARLILLLQHFSVPLQTVGAMSRTTVPGVAAKGGLQAARRLGSSGSGAAAACQFARTCRAACLCLQAHLPALTLACPQAVLMLTNSLLLPHFPAGPESTYRNDPGEQRLLAPVIDTCILE